MLNWRMVAAEDWLDNAQQLRDDRFCWFGWLGAVDEIGRGDQLRVLLQVGPGIDQPVGEAVTVATLLARAQPQLASISGVFPGASWCEREAATGFGIRFTPTVRTVGGALRKDCLLAARATTPWPGAADPATDTPGNRRRCLPPGVPDPAVWGNRHPDDPPLTPAELAGAVDSSRRRRR